MTPNLNTITTNCTKRKRQLKAHFLNLVVARSEKPLVWMSVLFVWNIHHLSQLGKRHKLSYISNKRDCEDNYDISLISRLRRYIVSSSGKWNWWSSMDSRIATDKSRLVGRITLDLWFFSTAEVIKLWIKYSTSSLASLGEQVRLAFVGEWVFIYSCKTLAIKLQITQLVGEVHSIQIHTIGATVFKL